MRIKSSLQDIPTGINRNIDSMYDNVKIVADNIDAIILSSVDVTLSLRYVGSFIDPPTVRFDGTDLKTGDFYFDLSSGFEGLYYYNLTSGTWLSGGEGGGAYDDSTVLAAIALNTDKVSNINHPLVEKAVPSDAVFTDTVYNDIPLVNAVNINTNKVSNIDHPLVEKAVPFDAVFTDTKYYIQDSGLTEKNFTLVKSNKLAGISENANNYVLPFTNNSDTWNTSYSWGDHSLAGYETTSYNDTNVYNAINEKQDTLVSSTNIKTINEISILGSGNINLESSVSWGNISGILSDQTNLQNALDSKINNEQVLTNVPIDAIFTDTIYNDAPIQNEVDLNTAKVGITVDQANDITNNNSKVTNVDYDDTDVLSAIDDKQDTLVSNSNIKTINGTTILGPGNISVTAGSTPTAAETKTAYESNDDTNAFSDTEKTKLTNTEDNANNYLHPENHPPSIIAQDIDNRFVTDDEKSYWNSNSGDQDVSGIEQNRTSINTMQSEVDLNTSKTGITTAQSDDITANNAKVSNVDHPLVQSAVPIDALFTDTIYDATTIQSEVDLNTDKVGITTVQANNITANNAKVSNIDHPLVEASVPANAVFTDTVYDDTTIQNEVNLNTAKVSNIDHPLVEKAVPANAKFTDTVYDDAVIQSEVDLNTAKVSNVDHPLVETAVPIGAVFTDNDTVYDDTNIQAEVDLNTAKVSNVDHPLVEKAVPAGAVFTDTTYSVGDGELTEFNFTQEYKDKLVAGVPTLVVTEYPASPVTGTLYIKVTP